MPPNTRQTAWNARLPGSLALGFCGDVLDWPMPTVLRVGGLRFVVYPNDRPPAPVNVIGPAGS